MKRYKQNSQPGIFYFTGIIILVAVFFIIAWLYHQPGWNRIDLGLLKDLQPLRSAQGISFFSWMSFIGTSKVLIVLIGLMIIYLFLKKHYLLAIFLVIDYLGERLINDLLKHFYQRQRPPFQHLIHAGGFSFPSGHAMNSLSVYGFIAFILFWCIKSKGLRRFSLAICTLIIILITFSRPYLNVHYFTDITAGWCMAGAWLLLLIWLSKKYVFFVRSGQV